MTPRRSQNKEDSLYVRVFSLALEELVYLSMAAPCSKNKEDLLYVCFSLWPLNHAGKTQRQISRVMKALQPHCIVSMN